MTLAQLEAALREAQEKKLKAIAARAPLQESSDAYNAVLQAERNLAAAKGEAYAVPIDFPVSWDTGSPRPLLLQNDYRTFLTFFLRADAINDLSERAALIEFEHCICTKMGTPNDEVLRGHPLNGKGLAGYEAMLVKNSAWLKELEAINAVHSQYKAEKWRDLDHFILPFHDSTFECVARGFKVEVLHEALNPLAEMCKRLNTKRAA